MKTKYLLSVLKKHWFESFIGLIGFLLLADSLTKERINDDTKILELKSTLKSYSFFDGARGLKQYYIYCNEYCNKFQIKADYLGFFEKENFPKEVGDSFLLKISSNDIPKINNCEKIFIYGISTKNREILSLANVINYESYKVDILIPLILIFGSITTIFVRQKRQIDTK